jgi:hypothetical protein
VVRAALMGGALVAVGLAAPTVVVGVPAAAAAQASCPGQTVTPINSGLQRVSCTYTYTGGEQTFIVPPDLASGLLVYAIDAAGQAAEGGFITIVGPSCNGDHRSSGCCAVRAPAQPALREVPTTAGPCQPMPDGASTIVT